MTPEIVNTITSAIDFSVIVTGMGAIGAAVAVVYIAQRGLKMLLTNIRS